MRKEREVALKKKMQEREYFDKIMQENAKNKAMKMAMLEKEKKEDLQLFE